MAYVWKDTEGNEENLNVAFNTSLIWKNLMKECQSLVEGIKKETKKEICTAYTQAVKGVYDRATTSVQTHEWVNTNKRFPYYYWITPRINFKTIPFKLSDILTRNIQELVPQSYFLWMA